jgi:hypothetical protein
MICCLLLSDFIFQNFHHSGQDDFAEHFVGDTEKVDAPPLFTVRQVAFFGGEGRTVFHDYALVQIIRNGCKKVTNYLETYLTFSS